MLRSLLVLVSLGCACGPASPGDGASGSSAGPAGSSGASDPTDTSEATGPAPTTDAATTGPAIPEACGPPPAPPTCDNSVDDPHLILCSGRDEEACGGVVEDGIECRWVSTEIFPADAVACASPTPSGACITVSNFGDGCEAPSTCAGTREDRTHYRFTEDCRVEVFTGSFCGYNVLGWNACAWAGTPDAECPLPWPSGGPATCNCAC